MSFFNVSASGRDGISTDYRPASKTHGINISAGIRIVLDGADAWLYLSIADARTLAAQLPLVLAEHDAVEREPAALADWATEPGAA